MSLSYPGDMNRSSSLKKEDEPEDDIYEFSEESTNSKCLLRGSEQTIYCKQETSDKPTPIRITLRRLRYKRSGVLDEVMQVGDDFHSKFHLEPVDTALYESVLKKHTEMKRLHIKFGNTISTRTVCS